MGRHKTISDDEVLAVARGIFRKRGHTATTREIADAAGISEAILYQRFGSKDDLFFAAMRPTGPDIEELLGPANPPEDAHAYLRRVVARIAHYFAEIIPLSLHVTTHPAFRRETFAKAHQFLTFTTPPNLQRAAAYALAKPHAYFEEMRAGFQRSRDRLVAALEGEGFVTLPAHGAYFVSIDLAASGIAMSDEAFAKHAIEHGVATIPYSAFYVSPGAPALVRLCFAKRDATLDRAAEALIKAKRSA